MFIYKIIYIYIMNYIYIYIWLLRFDHYLDLPAVNNSTDPFPSQSSVSGCVINFILIFLGF